MDTDYTNPFEEDYFSIEGIDYPSYDEHFNNPSLNKHIKWEPIKFNPKLWDDTDEDIPF
tara:strand:+ start:138 stop:314 length:177 start_codon:yes stop_codon:yes gene_type:complete